MSRYWLKMIGTSDPDCGFWGSYSRTYVDFKTNPSAIAIGDRLALYAVGGAKCFFALTTVSSNVKPSDNERWPYRIEVTYQINLPVSDGVPVEEVKVERDLIPEIQNHRGSGF